MADGSMRNIWDILNHVNDSDSQQQRPHSPIAKSTHTPPEIKQRQQKREGSSTSAAATTARTKRKLTAEDGSNAVANGRETTKKIRESFMPSLNVIRNRLNFGGAQKSQDDAETPKKKAEPPPRPEKSPNGNVADKLKSLKIPVLQKQTTLAQLQGPGKKRTSSETPSVKRVAKARRSKRKATKTEQPCEVETTTVEAVTDAAKPTKEDNPDTAVSNQSLDTTGSNTIESNETATTDQRHTTTTTGADTIGKLVTEETNTGNLIPADKLVDKLHPGRTEDPDSTRPKEPEVTISSDDETATASDTNTTVSTWNESILSITPSASPSKLDTSRPRNKQDGLEGRISTEQGLQTPTSGRTPDTGKHSRTKRGKRRQFTHLKRARQVKLKEKAKDESSESPKLKESPCDNNNETECAGKAHSTDVKRIIRITKLKKVPSRGMDLDDVSFTDSANNNNNERTSNELSVMLKEKLEADLDDFTITVTKSLGSPRSTEEDLRKTDEAKAPSQPEKKEKCFRASPADGPPLPERAERSTLSDVASARLSTGTPVLKGVVSLLKPREELVKETRTLSQEQPVVKSEESKSVLETETCVSVPLDLSNSKRNIVLKTPDVRNLPNAMLVSSPSHEVADMQPLDLSVKKTPRETDCPSTNLPSDAVTRKSREPNVQFQRSVYQTFSLNGINGRKVSPVRPHIRGKPVQERPGRSGAVGMPILDPPQINSPARREGVVILNNLKSDIQQSSPLIKDRLNSPALARLDTSFNAAKPVLKVPSIRPISIKPISKRQKSSTKRSPKRIIPTAHVKPNKIDESFNENTTSNATKETSASKFPSLPKPQTFPDISDEPPVLTTPLDLEESPDEMPVLSPCRFTSPGTTGVSTQNKTDSSIELTSPPTLTRLSPLPDRPIANNSSTSTPGNPEASLPNWAQQYMSSPGRSDKSPSTCPHECFLSTTSNISCNLEAFSYVPPKITRCRMDISNTRFYKTCDIKHGKFPPQKSVERLAEESTTKNVYESAFPRMQFSDDWKQDLVDYKTKNLRIPPKLVTKPKKVPKDFLEGINKFPSLRHSDRKLPSEPLQKQRCLQPSNGTPIHTPRYTFGGNFTSLKPAADSGREKDDSSSWQLKCVSLTSNDIEVALGALKIPSRTPEESPSAECEKKLMRKKRPLFKNKPNDRLLAILKRGGITIKPPSPKKNYKRKLDSKESPASSSETSTTVKPSWETVSSTPGTSDTPVCIFVPTPPVDKAALSAVPKSSSSPPKSSPPNTSPRRSPRSPRSPKKYPGDRWVFPTGTFRRLTQGRPSDASDKAAGKPAFSLTINLKSMLSAPAVVMRNSPMERKNPPNTLTEILGFDSGIDPKVMPDAAAKTSTEIKKSPKRSPKRSSKRDDRPVKKLRTSMLKQIANTDGYVAEKTISKKNDNLFVDPSQLSREERALQRALMTINEMDIKASSPTSKKLAPRSPKKSSSALKADSLKKKARRVQNNVASSKTFLNLKRDDFIPKLLVGRTRLQNAGNEERKKLQFIFHKDNAYEQALSIEEQRRELKRTIKRNALHLEPKPPIPESTSSKYEDTIESVIKAACCEDYVPPPRPAAQPKRTFGTKKKSYHNRTFGKKRRFVAKKNWRQRQQLTLKRSVSREAIFGIPAGQTPPQIELDIADDALQSLSAVSPGLKAPYGHHSQREEGNSSMCSPDSSRILVPPEVKKLTVCRDTGETVLHKAARMSYLDIVSWCCSTRYVDVNARDYAGFAALHETCVSEDVRIARCLLEHGADVNVASRLDGVRPLHDAIERDNFELVRLFLSYGADPTLSTYSGRTALKIASTPQMQAFLRSYLADLNGKKTTEAEEDGGCLKADGWEVPPQCPEEGQGSKSLEETISGFDIFTDIPKDDKEEDFMDKVIFDMSEDPFLPCYLISLEDGSRPRNYVLLSDLLLRVHKTAKEFRVAFPEVQVLTVHRSMVRGPQAGSLLTDVRVDDEIVLCEYDDSLREILNIDRETVTFERNPSKERNPVPLTPGYLKIMDLSMFSDSECSTIPAEDPNNSSRLQPNDSFVSAEQPVVADSVESFSDIETETADEMYSFTDCKGCSSPELSFDEQDWEVEDRTSTPKKINKLEPSQLYQQDSATPVGTQMFESAATFYAPPPKPLFIMSSGPDSFVQPGTHVPFEAATAEQSFPNWHTTTKTEVSQGSLVSYEPVTAETNLPNDVDDTSDNEYGLKIAQVCSLSANDALNVFGATSDLS